MSNDISQFHQTNIKRVCYGFGQRLYTLKDCAGLVVRQRLQRKQAL